MTGLNLACGEHADKAGPEWVNVDRYAMAHWVKQPDVVADAVLTLPFRDGTFDRFYLGHFLEHLENPDESTNDEMFAVASEITRVCKPGAGFAIVGPCYDQALMTGQPEWLLDLIRPPARYVEPRGIEHRWLSTGVKTLQLVRSMFDLYARQVAPAEVYPPFWPNPSAAPWQFAILGEIR